MPEFDPATLNPSAWYRADLGLYQDLGVTPAASDGQAEQAVASGDTAFLTYIMGICKNWQWSVPVKYLGADVAEFLWRKTLLTIQEQIDYETYLFTRYFKEVPITSSGRFPLHKL